MGYPGSGFGPPPPGSQYRDQRGVNGGMLALSILATIFCCLPFGIVAIVFTAQGDDERAKPWLIASAVCGAIAVVIVILARSG